MQEEMLGIGLDEDLIQSPGQGVVTCIQAQFLQGQRQEQWAATLRSPGQSGGQFGGQALAVAGQGGRDEAGP